MEVRALLGIAETTGRRDRVDICSGKAQAVPTPAADLGAAQAMCCGSSMTEKLQGWTWHNSPVMKQVLKERMCKLNGYQYHGPTFPAEL